MGSTVAATAPRARAASMTSTTARWVALVWAAKRSAQGASANSDSRSAARDNDAAIHGKARAVAERLRELCVEQGFIVDPSVFEASRVLRIPGTFNFKQEEPKLVEVLNENSARIPYAQLKELLGAAEPKPDRPDFIPQSMSPMMEALLGNKVKRFKTIMMRSANGTGCNQLLNCYENQATIEEPLWRSALSIATFCIDRDTAVHKISREHPGYDQYEVELKVENLLKNGGPHHCATFEKLNPTGCDDCPHKGKIKSPIVLGIEIEEADAEDNEVEIVTEESTEIISIPEYPI